MPEGSDTPQDRAYRVGFKRTKREDYAVDLLRSARANLHDVESVNRILLELGRYYNAIADAPIVTLETRQHVIQSLHEGHLEEAERLLDECLERYRVTESEQ